ncbi:MAG: metalloregulator ArsR/SmtB family transcription factor [Myxococcales bacterium]|nr:metalloregulator ArsR/SmtB family transcription factor [Myxococcales bacterium]MDH5306664.1 metalloregulator ArsR/SmtB family transcription factor [Myxococcales bacterium]
MNSRATRRDAEPIRVAPTSLFGAFADATRLRILSLLSDGELCVCDLCAVLEESQPKISRHLATLRRAGLVQVRREGKWKVYALAPAPSALHQSLVGCVRRCLGELDELAEDRARLRRRAPRARCG